MGFLTSMAISANGMTTQRMRMDIISQNLANVTNTRTVEGGPYRRKVIITGEKTAVRFSAYMDRASTLFGSGFARAGNTAFTGLGSQVLGIATDASDFKMEYDPTHPDADEMGYVSYPNVDELAEMVDLMAATRAFDANVTAFNAAKSMALKALEIGR